MPRVWSLSLPQMAATLAAAVVAYKSVNASGARLLDESSVERDTRPRRCHLRGRPDSRRTLRAPDEERAFL